MTGSTIGFSIIYAIFVPAILQPSKGLLLCYNCIEVNSTFGLAGQQLTLFGTLPPINSNCYSGSSDLEIVSCHSFCIDGHFVVNMPWNPQYMKTQTDVPMGLYARACADDFLLGIKPFRNESCCAAEKVIDLGGLHYDTELCQCRQNLCNTPNKSENFTSCTPICSPNPCKDNEDCSTDENLSFYCDKTKDQAITFPTEAPYSPSILPSDINCTTNTCKNGGECVTDIYSSKHYCYCPNGWTGLYCNQPKNTTPSAPGKTTPHHSTVDKSTAHMSTLNPSTSAKNTAASTKLLPSTVKTSQWPVKSSPASSAQTSSKPTSSSPPSNKPSTLASTMKLSSSVQPTTNGKTAKPTPVTSPLLCYNCRQSFNSSTSLGEEPVGIFGEMPPIHQNCTLLRAANVEVVPCATFCVSGTFSMAQPWNKQFPFVSLFVRSCADNFLLGAKAFFPSNCCGKQITSDYKGTYITSHLCQCRGLLCNDFRNNGSDANCQSPCMPNTCNGTEKCTTEENLSYYCDKEVGPTVSFPSQPTIIAPTLPPSKNCSSSPCKNGGICVTEGRNHFCFCSKKWSGEYCTLNASISTTKAISTASVPTSYPTTGASLSTKTGVSPTSTINSSPSSGTSSSISSSTTHAGSISTAQEATTTIYISTGNPKLSSVKPTHRPTTATHRGGRGCVNGARKKVAAHIFVLLPLLLLSYLKHNTFL